MENKEDISNELEGHEKKENTSNILDTEDNKENTLNKSDAEEKKENTSNKSAMEENSNMPEEENSENAITPGISGKTINQSHPVNKAVNHTSSSNDSAQKPRAYTDTESDAPVHIQTNNWTGGKLPIDDGNKSHQLLEPNDHKKHDQEQSNKREKNKKESTDTISVLVSDSPVCNKQPENQTVKEGDNATFQCHVQCKYGKARITWYHESQTKAPLADGDIYKITQSHGLNGMISSYHSTLEILCAVKKDEGKFIAKVRYENENEEEEDIIQTYEAKLNVKNNQLEHWNICQKDKEKWNGVDFQQIDIIDKIMKVVRFFTHGFIMLTLMTCIIVSKASLQILVAELGKEEKRTKSDQNEQTVTRDILIYLWIFALSLPDIWTAVYHFWRMVFGKSNGRPSTTDTSEGNSSQNPESEITEEEICCFPYTCVALKEFIEKNWKQVLFVIQEILHGVGAYGLTLRVFPYLDPLELVVLSALLPVIPSIANTISAFKYKLYEKYNTLCSLKIYHIFDILSAIVQLIITAVYLHMCVSKYKAGHLNLDTLVWIVLSILFVCTRWLQTYLNSCKDIREQVNEYYTLTQIIAAMCRILIPFIFIPCYYAPQIRSLIPAFREFVQMEINSTDILNRTITYTKGCTGGAFEYIFYDDSENIRWHYVIVGPFLSHFLSAFLCYHFAVLSCRLCMQRISCAVPLIAAPPIYVLIIFMEKRISFFRDISLLGCYSYSDEMKLMILFFLAWTSQFLLCKQIFVNQTAKMPYTESLFNLPHYCSPLTDLSILHSRKKFDLHSKQRTDEPSNSRTSQSVESPNQQSTTDDLGNIAMIYICATMRHETSIEMKNLLTSLLRLDYDHAVKHNAKRVEGYQPESADSYDFEGHIFFDDAFETKKTDSKGKERVVNKFVEQFYVSIDEALREFYNSTIRFKDPEVQFTIYGLRITWTLPGQNILVVHLKDKDKFRHKKRWSQVMYFYYLLGYKLLQENRDKKTEDNQKKNYKTENTFILALDGDVEFYPIALTRLVERMFTHPLVAATCGRIVPCGSGPVVWYQRFEYAIGHWLQKSTEHVFGSVLCSPGCFSLFRAKCIMDGNIMRTYASKSTKPEHFVQFDQGEDRWFCTLLLKNGYGVEYFAASEAKTFVPEEFSVLFDQRKRWITSTIANIYDVLINSKQIRMKNPNISWPYVIYQFLLLVSTVLGPSTILLAMEAALRVVFDFDPWLVYTLVYGPVVLYVFICLKLNSDIQRQVGLVLSLSYALLMLAVLIGTFVSIVNEGWYTPSATFLYILFGTFFIAGLLHIHEITDLLFGFLYFIFLPLGYLYIMIYAVCNLNNISWGTRENQIPESPSSGRANNQQDMSARKQFEEAKLNISQEIRKQIIANKNSPTSVKNKVLDILNWSHQLLQWKLFQALSFEHHDSKVKEDNNMKRLKKRETGLHINLSAPIDKNGTQQKKSNEKRGKLEENLPCEERIFWRQLRRNYLEPAEKNPDSEEELKRYRNRVASVFFFFNGVWIVIVTSMNQVKQELNIKIDFSNGQPITIEPFGFTFLAIFTLLLFIQIIGMFIHRYRTFLHVIAATDLRSDRLHDNLEIRKNVHKILCPKLTNTENRHDMKRYYCCPRGNKIKDNNENRKENKNFTRDMLKRAAKEANITENNSNGNLNLRQVFEDSLTKHPSQ